MRADMTAAACPANTRNGQPCRMKPGPSGWCFCHDPQAAKARTAARSRGGLRRAGTLARAVLHDNGVPLELQSPDAVRVLLADTIRNTLTGRLDPRVAATVGQLSATVLRALEQGSMDDRLAALEEALAQNRRGIA